MGIVLEALARIDDLGWSTHLCYGLHRPLLALPQLLAGGVMRQADVIRLQRIVVLLHEELEMTLAAVALCEVWGQPDALVSILQVQA